MSSLLKIHELTFALVIRDYDLSLSQGKFLNSSGIVPNDWSFARQPVANQRVSQTVYSNGVSIVGEPHRCLFSETLDDKKLEAFYQIYDKYCISKDIFSCHFKKKHLILIYSP